MKTYIISLVASFITIMLMYSLMKIQDILVAFESSFVVSMFILIVIIAVSGLFSGWIFSLVYKEKKVEKKKRNEKDKDFILDR